MDHQDFKKLANEGKIGTIWDELRNSRTQLEDVIQDYVPSFAYPNGSYTPAVVDMATTVYDSAVSTISGRTQTEAAQYLLRRLRPN